MNIIFIIMILGGFIVAALHGFNLPADATTVPMQIMTDAVLKAAQDAVDLSIGLIGVMTLFLGLTKIAEEGGLLNKIAKLLRPLLIRLFPEVPSTHPAMGAMVMNLSANALGLANAATPFGIKAMHELEKLNSKPGTATNAMALFLAINTSSVTLLPTGVIALRSAAGSLNPAGIVPTTLFATFISTFTAILMAKFFERLAKKSAPEALVIDGELQTVEPAYPIWICATAIFIILCTIPLMVVYSKEVSPWIIPGLIASFLIFGWARKVRVYEAFVEGAKEGVQVAFRIIPYLVAILCAIAMLRASGAMDSMVGFLSHFTEPLGLPAEALPMALLRPLSGSGAFAYLAALLNDPAIGPDSYIGYLVSTIQGSTETTFYVLAVYFGAVGIKKARHAIAAALIADVAGVAASVWIVSALYA